MPQHPRELDQQEEELNKKGLIVRRRVAASVEATTATTDSSSAGYDKTAEEEDGSTLGREQPQPQPLQRRPQEIDREEDELNQKGVLLAAGVLEDDANPQVGVVPQPRPKGKLTTCISSSITTKSEKAGGRSVSVLSAAGGLPGEEVESREEEENEEPAAAADGNNNNDTLFSAKKTKSQTDKDQPPKLGAVYVNYAVDNAMDHSRTSATSDASQPPSSLLSRSHRLPPPPSEPGAIPIRLTPSGRTLAITESGHFSTASPPQSTHFDLGGGNLHNHNEEEEEPTPFDTAVAPGGLISATVVDEEMQARAAEDKARDNILQEMVQGEAMILEEKSTSTKKWGIMAGVLLLVVVVVVLVAVVFAGGNNNNNGKEEMETFSNIDGPDTTTATTISDYDYLVGVLSPISGGEEPFHYLQKDSNNSSNDTSSTDPRTKAFYWMLEEDDFWRSHYYYYDSNTTIIETDDEKNMETLIMERYIHAVLFYSTQGEDWTRDISFLSTNSSVCQWPPLIAINDESEAADGEQETTTTTRTDGVSCNAQQRVTDIDLTGINLNGTIPPELGRLEFLRNLRMEDNQLSGTIPHTLSQLDFLTLFHVSWNSITGTIPDSFAAGVMNSLESINLNSNMITGTLPSGIFRIESLRQFNGGENQLTGTIPDFPARGKLEGFWVGSNHLEGSIPPSLFTSTEITSLGLYLNKLTGTLPPTIGNFVDMNIMYLDGNHLNGTLPPELGLLRSMEFLWLNYNDFTGVIPSQLGNLGKFNLLSELVLSFTNLSGEVPLELGQLENIFTIDLANTSISGNLDPVFCDNGLSIPKLTSDCGGGNSSEVQCSCCTACCDDATGDCETRVDQICSLMAESVKDPVQPLEFVLMQDDVKPLNPACECSGIPASANRTSFDGKVPVMDLSCHESTNCTVCTPDGSVCGRRYNFGFTWDENGIWTHQTMGFQYTKGRDDLLLLEFDVSSQNPPYLYKMYLNGELCNELNAEAVCADGNPAFEVDCGNVQEGAVYSQCDGLVPNAGALEYFTPTMYGVSSKCDNESR